MNKLFNSKIIQKGRGKKLKYFKNKINKHYNKTHLNKFYIF